MSAAPAPPEIRPAPHAAHAQSELSFQLLGRAVFLLLIAKEDRRNARRHRGGRHQRDASQFRAGEPGRAFGQALGEESAERVQDVWLRREAILVEVVRAGSPAAQREGSAQNAGVGDAPGDLRAGECGWMRRGHGPDGTVGRTLPGYHGRLHGVGLLLLSGSSGFRVGDPGPDRVVGRLSGRTLGGCETATSTAGSWAFPHPGT
jgi:hypothetical protein